MIELIYTSRVAPHFTGETMKQLLQQSRKNNADLGITGILFFGSGRFIQILEGPDEAVASVYETIQSDNRHEDVSLLHKEDINRRSFGNWLMSYEPLSSEDLKKLDNFKNEIQVEEVLDLTKDTKKNFGAHLFGILTGAALRSS